MRALYSILFYIIERRVLKIDEQELLKRLEEIEKWENEGAKLTPYAFLHSHRLFLRLLLPFFGPYSVYLNNLLA